MAAGVLLVMMMAACAAGSVINLPVDDFARGGGAFYLYRAARAHPLEGDGLFARRMEGRRGP